MAAGTLGFSINPMCTIKRSIPSPTGMSLRCSASGACGSSVTIIETRISRSCNTRVCLRWWRRLRGTPLGDEAKTAAVPGTRIGGLVLSRSKNSLVGTRKWARASIRSRSQPPSNSLVVVRGKEHEVDQQQRAVQQVDEDRFMAPVESDKGRQNGRDHHVERDGETISPRQFAGRAKA